MSISNLLGRLLGGNGGSIELREYECVECGHTFDSAKRPERAQCMECLSNDVEVVGAAEGS